MKRYMFAALFAAGFVLGGLPCWAQGQQPGFRLVELKKGGAADKWDGKDPKVGFGDRVSIRLDDDPNAPAGQNTIAVQKINIDDLRLYINGVAVSKLPVVLRMVIKSEPAYQELSKNKLQESKATKDLDTIKADLEKKRATLGDTKCDDPSISVAQATTCSEIRKMDEKLAEQKAAIEELRKKIRAGEPEAWIEVTLDRSDNRAEWAGVLKTLTRKSSPLRFDVSTKGTQLAINCIPVSPQLSFEAKGDPFGWIVIIVGTLLLIAGVAWAVWKRILLDPRPLAGTGLEVTRYGSVKDGALPEMPTSAWPYSAFSLARTQMVWWFVIVVGSFIWLYGWTLDYDVLTAETLALIGISGVTALGAKVVDQNKLGPRTEALRVIKSKYEGTINLLKAAIASSNAAEVARLDAERTVLEADLFGDSRGFFQDLLTDENGVTVYRLQTLVWNVALAGIFIYEVIAMKTMPQFSATLLGLLGISNGTYLGFKMPEVQIQRPAPR
jgi:hypothetical protein